MADVSLIGAVIFGCGPRLLTNVLEWEGGTGHAVRVCAKMRVCVRTRAHACKCKLGHVDAFALDDRFVGGGVADGETLTDEGAPGDRGGIFYAGYFRDLDGNKLNAFHLG